MRRNYRFEILEIILAAAVVLLTAVLFFKAQELSILFPITFGLATLMSFLYVFENYKYNRNRKTRRNRMIAYSIIGLLLLVLTVGSIFVVSR